MQGVGNEGLQERQTRSGFLVVYSRQGETDYNSRTDRKVIYTHLTFVLLLGLSICRISGRKVSFGCSFVCLFTCSSVFVMMSGCLV